VRTFLVEGCLGSSRVITGGALSDLEKLCPRPPSAVITDTNVRELYGEIFPPAPVIVVAPGEKSKSLSEVEGVLRRLSDLEIGRDGFVLGIGGGMVSDLTGFCASVYLRGIGFGFVPTTLLAQVDAAVGGKNGVNLDGYKNLVGTITQPSFVLCVGDFLRSLDPDLLRAGLSECVKAGAIADGELFELIESESEALLGGEPALLEEVVEKAVAVKVAVVNEDERESGCRRLLNFGHTFGHALEKVTGIPHGEAVSMGMALAGRLSVARGLLSEDEEKRLTATLVALGLPVSLEGDPAPVLEALRRDKKRTQEDIRFILLAALGRAAEVPISLEELSEVLLDLR